MTALFQTADDPVGLVDTTSRAIGVGAKTDLVGLTDSTSKAISLGAKTDTAGLTDSFGMSDSHVFVADDSMGLVDNGGGIIPTITSGPDLGIITTGVPVTATDTGLVTVGGTVYGGTVVAPVPSPSTSTVPITTGGTSVGGTTTGGTTVAGVAPTGAQYAAGHGYTKLGWYTGYSVGTKGTGSLLKATQALETLTGQAIEVLSEGLPNDISDPTNDLLHAQGCPQLIVWAAPVVPMGSGSIARGLLGDYDAKIVATGAAFAAHRPKDCLRVGWEALGNYYSWGLGAIDPYTGRANTMDDIKKMKRRYVTKVREGGFTGLIDFCDGTDDTRLPYVEEWWPGDDVGDVVGMDVYAGTPSTAYKFNYQYVWDNVRKPALDKIVAYARAHGKYVGFGECGTLSKNTPYVVDDSQHPLFWQLMQQYCADNSDVILYLCTWNQNQISNGIVTEEGQIVYCGDPAGQATNTLHNTAVEGPWFWTPSPNLHQSMLGWRKYMVTGSMQSNGSGISSPGSAQTTTGGTTTGAVTTGGLTEMPDGSNRSNATITGGTITGGTLLGGTLASGVVTGGTSTGGSVSGGTVSGGTVGSGSYVGGTLQPDGTLIGGTLTGGTSTGGSVRGGITTEPDGTGVINGTVTGGVSIGGVTTGGIYDPRTGILTGGTTTGATTYNGAVAGGIVVAVGTDPVNLPSPNQPGSTTGAVPVQGLIGWDYTGTGVVAFKVIAFSAGPQPLKVAYDVAVSGTGRQHLQTSIGDVSQFSWVIYPVDAGGNIGQGALYTEGWFLDPPTAGYAPLEPSPPVPGTVSVTSPTGQTTSLNAEELGIGFSNTSNFWYVGAGENVALYGHTPAMALDDDDNSYWLSIGNDSPTADYAFEWYEVTVPDQEVTSVRFHNVGTGYFVYVSVFAAGVWVSHNAADIIPYNAKDPLSHNGGNIPYAETINCSTGDGPYEVTLRAPIPKVTKVRITYHHLQDFTGSVSSLPWRAALRKIKVFGLVSSTSTTGGTTVVRNLGPVHDYDSPDVLQSYTTYIPPVETPGAGENPGTYEDYCLSETAEILTKRGWLFWNQVDIGDEALAIDPATGLSSWQVITDVFREHRKRTMIEMSGASHYSLSTPDHRWLVQDTEKRWRWRTTETLNTADRIPLTVPRADNPVAPVFSDDLVELVAWFYTEGSSTKYGGEIPQSHRVNPAYVDRIRGCLTRLYGSGGHMGKGRRMSAETIQQVLDLLPTHGNWQIEQLTGVSNKTVRRWRAQLPASRALWSESASAQRGMTFFNLSRLILDDLTELAPAKVPSPEFLTQLTADQLELFIDVSIKADGWTTSNGGREFGQNRDEIGMHGRTSAFEMACALAGYATSRHPVSGTNCDATTVRRRSWLHPKLAASAGRRFTIREVDYDGIIWCPTLEHHNWLARDRGCTFFTGNTDIVKLLCAWGGFYWPPNATQLESSGAQVHYDFGGTTFGLANVDPVLGDLAAGRVWGDFQNTGVAGIAALPIPQWDKKSLLDGISYVRDIIGYLFYVDETGGVVWRLPNIYSVGNYVSALSSEAARSTTMVTIDEKVTLIELRAKLSSRNVRERYFVASTDGTNGALAEGYNANPIGLRRVAGWTDQHFGSNTECLIMADQIALRALMTYRVDTIQIPGYPRIQVDDQVHINERVTAESFLHYVRGISSTNDLESGVWTYDLDTNWLGVDPFSNWVFNPATLSAELQAYLAAVQALGAGSFQPPPDDGGTTTKDVVKVAKLVKVATVAAVYITDGITKRHVLSSAEETELLGLGVITSTTPTTISGTLMAAIPDAP